MKATILESVMGVLGFDDANKLVGSVLFPKDPEIIAQRLAEIQAGKIVEEIANLVQKLKDAGFTFFVFENAEIARSAHDQLKIAVEVAKSSEAGELLRRSLEDFAVELKFVEEGAELRDLMHKVSMELTKMRVRKAVEKRDLVVAQAVLTIDDIDRTANLFMSRIREWFGLHFPELDRLVEKHETYARLVANLGRRENFTLENLEKEGLPKDRAKHITFAAEKSMGADMEDQDLNQVQALCRNTLQLYEARQSLEGYMDAIMEDVAPNVKALVGSILGARLIALTGGLINLAKMPASTIQVLGAEKALFRSLKTGARPPKHGIIFQHTIIHEAKRWQRGKMARAVAGKLAIAARTDAFSGKYHGDSLKVGLERRIKEIQEKYETPPPMQPQQPQRQQPKMKHQPRRKQRGYRR